MPKNNLTDIRTVIAVAREGSFTKTAARLGVSQSAISYSVRMLEEQLGVRLLARTTRSLSPTETGQRLIDRLAPMFEDIESELVAMAEQREKPAGIVRINSVEHASESILWPALRPVMAAYPEINIEIDNDYRLVDIVAARFDAGLFIVSRCIPASPLAGTIGCALMDTPLGTQIQTSDANETSIPGMFVCGDVARIPNSVSLAVGAGAWAGAQLRRPLVWPDS